jgi:GPH family glycoside/pentoside/hexuronide:cation symporter
LQPVEGETVSSACSADGEAKERAARLSVGRKAAYGAGQLVDLVVSGMLNIFVLFYVTAVCGLPGGLAGLALGLGIVVDAVMDPLIGSASDGWRSRFGRRVPFMAASLPPLLLTFNLIFALPDWLGQTALFCWLLFLSVSLRISLSVFHLPYQALGAELSDDYEERSSISIWRWGIGIFGMVAVIVLGYGVFFAGPGGVSDRAAYLPLTLSLSLLILLGAVVAIRQGLATRHRQHETEAAAEPIYSRLLGEMKEMVRNPTFRILFAAALFFNIGLGVNQALALHLATFFWGMTSAQMQIVFLPAVLGLALAAPIAGSIARRVEKRTLLIASMAGMTFCHGLPATLRLLGLLDVHGNSLIALLSPVVFIGSAMMALSIIAFVAIIPDAADEHEQLFGARREALYFAGWAFATKAATGAGVLIAGLALQLMAFPADVAESDQAAKLPEQTLAWLGFAGGPGSALLSVAGMVFILFYRIDKKAHAAILAALQARKR